MNKRLGLLSLFGITALLLVMVGAITAMAAPSAATVTGTVSLDKSWYKVGSTVKITVSDKDTTDLIDANVNIGGASGLAAQNTTRKTLASSPIVGTPTAVTPGTSTVVSGLDVIVYSASLGIVDVLTSVERAAGFLVDIKYSAVVAASVNVKVTSDQDPTNPITVAALKKAGSPGDFEVSITIVDVADSTKVSSSTAKTLKAGNAGNITAEYSDATPATDVTAPAKRTAKAGVETLPPAFSSLLPADKFSTKADGDKLTISGSVSDTGGSGIKKSKLKVVLDTSYEFDPTVAGTDGDASVTFTLELTKANYEAKAGVGTWVAAHKWYVKGEDVSGNAARSDAVVDVVGTASSIGDQDHNLTVDQAKPTMDSAETGRFWDTSLTTAAEGSNRLTSLVVIFSDDMDATSISKEDFTVAGVAPIAADVVTKAKKKVYLTLATALDPAAKPEVALVTGASVADAAGNTQDTGKLAASITTGVTGLVLDKIAPTFVVALDKTLTKDKVVVTVTSDEALSGVPTVNTYDKNGAAKSSGSLVSEPLTSTSWKATFTAGAGDVDGKWSVVVSGSDDEQPGNARTEGDPSVNVSKAIVFTLDRTAPTLTFSSGAQDFSAASKDVEGTAPTISVNFSEKVTIDKAGFGLSDATALTDVKASGALAADGKTWIYLAGSLTVNKSYIVRLSVTDLAGNKAENISGTFKSVAVKLPETPLKPGQNLISFTGNPVNGDINTVFSDAAVTAVVTYDPTNPDPTTGSPWLIATRGTDGKLSGSLAKVDGQHAYFVKSSAFGSVKVEVAKLGFDAVPSVIAVVKGWNLLPVASVTGAFPLAADKTCATAADSCVLAANYLGTIKWVTAYTYNQLTNAWLKIQPKTFDNLELGKGYWVYTSEAGTLVP